MPKRLISLFSFEIHSLILPIKFVREPLFGVRIFGTSKSFMLRGGHRDFPLVSFWPPSTENIRG